MKGGVIMTENKSSFIRVNMTEAEKQIIVKMAEAKEMSLSAFVRGIIKDYLRQNGEI